jgi:hypothetical protein
LKKSLQKKPRQEKKKVFLCFFPTCRREKTLAVKTTDFGSLAPQTEDIQVIKQKAIE